MSNNFNLEKIKFIQKNDIIEPVEDGYSGAFLYKIIRGNQKYFLKVFNQKYNEKKITKIHESLRIYKNLNINSLEIIDYSNIENEDKYYIVYNYIDGVSLKVYFEAEKVTKENIEQFGKLIGKELLKLKNYKDYDKSLFEVIEIYSFCDKVIDNFEDMLKDEKARNIFNLYFSLENLELLKNELKENWKLLENIEPNLIHGDIKSSNIMIDNFGKLFIVDIESMQLNYDIINFTYQMIWCLTNENETMFVKGFFDGLYQNTRPIYFNNLIISIAIINFFNTTFHIYKKNNFSKLEWQVQYCWKLFNQLKLINLENEYII